MKILSTGSSLPATVLTNDEIAWKFGLCENWIFTRTGIRERRIADSSEGTRSFAVEAARRALESASVLPSEIGFVVVATSSPDRLTPSTATSVQAALGLDHAFCYDLSAGCSGFLYALKTAQTYLAAGLGPYGLIVGAETLSRHIDWMDEQTCALFGDGAGAVIVRSDRENIFEMNIFSDGRNQNFLQMGEDEVLADRDFLIRMNGREVFKRAVDKMQASAKGLFEKWKLTGGDFRYLLCHQANIRIVDAVRDRLGMKESQVPANIDRLGNTGAASIPLLLDELRRMDRLSHGDLLAFSAFGAGFTWGCGLMRW